MGLILPFLSGFIAAAIGVFPPGLINMTAAKVSLKEGKSRSLIFISGALIVIFIQTYISVIFARYINNHDEIVSLLHKIGLIVFSLLTLYFLFLAKKPMATSAKDLKIKSKASRFFLGVLISSINLFPIPYYVFVSVTLASLKIFNFEPVSVYSLVTGVVTGSLTVFYCYIVFFEKLKSKTDYFAQNMNTIIGTVTGIVALISLINVLNIEF